MEPTPIGYFPKQVATEPGPLAARGVREVCSVSGCISRGPEGWIDRWAHNEMWVFDDEQSAWSVVPGGSANANYRMFAYRLFPVVFDEGEQRPFAIPPMAVQPRSRGRRRDTSRRLITSWKSCGGRVVGQAF
jgi:hypothetical protein